LYDRALLNGAALRAVGYTKDTPDPTAGEIQRDKRGNPTGLLLAKPNAYILYSTLFKGPKLSREDQLNSSRLFFRELNRFGITSAVDAGGGFQNYPDDYEVVNELHQTNQVSVRLAYNLYPQKPSKSSRISTMDKDDETWPRRRLLSREWRWRDARVFGSGF
jgi:predicted amidohydrolase YtcJ